MSASPRDRISATVICQDEEVNLRACLRRRCRRDTEFRSSIPASAAAEAMADLMEEAGRGEGVR